jgi:Tfp pilus assembly protein PilX
MNMPKRSSQKGIALFFALIFILILSVLGVSIMFVSQMETWSSLNYREMTQARYGAEAGLNSAANYIVNTFCAPGNSTCSNGNAPASGDTASLYNTNVSPVTLVSNGSTVTLSTTSSASNYPVASVETAFQTAALGSVAAGNTTVNYTATATLMAMNQVTTAGGTATVQTWKIKADGAIAGIRAATEEVTGVVEQQVTFGASSLPAYAAFATGNVCSAVTMSGNATVNSYNSAAPLKSGSVVLNNYGGDVGTNGNISLQGSATIDGTFSSPRTGVSDAKKLASCTTGTATEIAIDQTLATSVSECATASSCGSAPVQLSQPITLTNPTMPTAPSSWNTGTTITVGSGTTCASLSAASPPAAQPPVISAAGCSGSAGNLTFSPSAALTATGFPPIVVDGGAKLALTPGTYNIDSISVSGGAALTTNATTGSLTLNTNSINLSGGNSLVVNNSNPITMNVFDGLGSSSGVSMTNGTAMSMSGSGLVMMNIDPTVANPFTASGAFSNVNSAGAPVPANFQILYGGTGPISLYGGATCAGVVYAPNAPVSIPGGTAWYGALIGSTVTDTNGAVIYYDTQLANVHIGGIVATVQPFMMDSFSWARF